MKRNEYVEGLTVALAFLPEESRRAAIAFYSEMIDDRMEDGMDEESAVDAMERPEDIAARLRAEGIEEIPSPLRVGIRDEALEFASLADSALQGVEKAMADVQKADETRAAEQTQPTAEAQEENAQPAQEPQPQATTSDAWRTADEALESVGRILEKAGKTVSGLFSEQGAAKDASVSSEYERKELTCPADSLDAAVLTVSNMPVSVKPAEGDDVTLVYYTSEREPYRAAAENGALKLWKEERDNGRGSAFNFFFNGFKMVWAQPAPTVELFVPRQALLDLTVRTGNSSIRVEGLRALCAVDLTTSNSRITVRDVACMTLALKTSNSRLEMEDVTAKKSIQGRTSNARIEASRVSSGGNLTLAASNGRIVARQAGAAGEASLTTSNGAIAAEITRASGITLRSSNGPIQATVPGHQEDWSISSGTSNGKNTLPRQQPGGAPLSVHTSNGNILVGFAGK